MPYFGHQYQSHSMSSEVFVFNVPTHRLHCYNLNMRTILTGQQLQFQLRFTQLVNQTFGFATFFHDRLSHACVVVNPNHEHEFTCTSLANFTIYILHFSSICQTISVDCGFLLRAFTSVWQYMIVSYIFIFRPVFFDIFPGFFISIIYLYPFNYTPPPPSYPQPHQMSS